MIHLNFRVFFMGREQPLPLLPNKYGMAPHFMALIATKFLLASNAKLRFCSDLILWTIFQLQKLQK